MGTEEHIEYLFDVAVGRTLTIQMALKGEGKYGKRRGEDWGVRSMGKYGPATYVTRSDFVVPNYVWYSAGSSWKCTLTSPRLIWAFSFCS